MLVKRFDKIVYKPSQTVPHNPVNIMSQSGENVNITFIDLSAGSQGCQTQSSTGITVPLSQIVGSLASAFTHPLQNVGSAVSVGNQPINRKVEISQQIYRARSLF